jgi:hypothetical protein
VKLLRNFSLNTGWLASLIARLPGVREDHPSPSVVIPPSPDALAVAFSQALMSTGQYETPGAAISAAWHVVPEFYMGRQHYAQEIAPMFFARQAFGVPYTAPDRASDQQIPAFEA